MHLIQALAAGVAGAASGTAVVRRRGTSTDAQTYSDVYGASANALGTIQLDANGGATLYVDGPVDVTVRDSAGATVRSFSPVDEATAVSYSGPSFKGVDPVTGVTAINKPVLLKTILDLFKTSFGTTDGLVSFAGSDRYLVDVLAGLNCYYNVMDPLYGAKGDGTTDDTAAIQAACDAANVAGGGTVWFPSTTGGYKISDGISLGASTNLLGASVGGTLITQSAYASHFSITTVATGKAFQTFIRGLRLKSSVANANPVITFSDSNIVLEQCEIGDGTYSTGNLVVNTDNDGSTPCSLTARDCLFSMGSPDGEAIECYLGTVTVTLDACTFVPPATYDNVCVIAQSITATNCRFKMSNVTSYGSGIGVVCIQLAAGSCVVNNCVFEDDGASGATTAMYYIGGTLVESGNSFGTHASFVAYGGISPTAALASVKLLTRETRSITITSNDIALTLPFDQYATIYLIRTANTATPQTFTSKYPPVGSNSRIIVRNTIGAGLAPLPLWNFGARVYFSNYPAIADNMAITKTFACVDVDGAGAAMVETSMSDAILLP